MNTTTQTRTASWLTTQFDIGPRTQEVVAALRSYPEGLTAWEIADQTKRYVHAVRPRLTELRNQGLVTIVGTRYQDKTDRREAVWRLVQTDLDGQTSFA